MFKAVPAQQRKPVAALESAPGREVYEARADLRSRSRILSQSNTEKSSGATNKWKRPSLAPCQHAELGRQPIVQSWHPRVPQRRPLQTSRCSVRQSKSRALAAPELARLKSASKMIIGPRNKPPATRFFSTYAAFPNIAELRLRNLRANFTNPPSRVNSSKVSSL